MLAACAMLLSGCGGGSTAAPSPPARSVGTRLDAAVPKSILALPFTDSQGHVRHLSDFAGKLLVLSDSMTLCQESCPLDTAGVVQTAREVAKAGNAHGAEFLTVTVDPQRDTPRRLAAYRKLFRPSPVQLADAHGDLRERAPAVEGFRGVRQAGEGRRLAPLLVTG